MGIQVINGSVNKHNFERLWIDGLAPSITQLFISITHAFQLIFLDLQTS